MATTTAPPGEGLTIHAAAAALGMSPSTVRRRIKEGRLHAMQRPTTQGYEWRVFLGDHLPTTGAHLPTSGDQVVTTNGADDDYVLTRGEQVATTGWSEPLIANHERSQLAPSAVCAASNSAGGR